MCCQVYVQGSGDLAGGTSPSESLTRRILDSWFASRQEGERYTLCDPLAIVALLRPELFSFRRASVAVDISDTERRGIHLRQLRRGPRQGGIGRPGKRSQRGHGGPAERIAIPAAGRAAGEIV